MKLEGIHHITAITENAQRNVDFYAGVLGLRLVKKTVNQDQPTVYHLFYADEKGERGLRPDLLRVPRRRPGPRRRRHGPPDRLAGRLLRLDRRSGQSGSATTTSRPAEADGTPALRRPRGPRARAGRRRRPRRAADRRPPRDPRRARPAGLRRGARLRRRPRGQRRAARGARVRAARRRRLGGARRRPRRPLRSTTAALRPGPAGRRQRPPRRLGLADRRARGVAASARSMAAPRRPR